MQLDPYARRFLDMIAAARAPDISQLTPAQMRLAYANLARLMEGPSAPAVAIENAELAGPAGPLPIRIYTPSVPAMPSSGLIFFHGGGWVFGSIETHDGLCRRLASEAGCRVISVEYRLAPEHGFPAAVEDALAATRWIANNADKFGIDPKKLAIGGDSAGGNLAAVVCQSARGTGGSALALQVLLCPVLDLGLDSPSRRAFAEGYFLNRETVDWSLRHYLPPNVDISDPRVSPLRAADLRGLPPAHIHTAQFDPLCDEGKDYADRLKQAGVDVRYIRHDGMIHNFYAMAGIIPYARTALKEIGSAIRDALA